MTRKTTLFMLMGLMLLPVTLLPGCGCHLLFGDTHGNKAVDISMGGKITAVERLDFTAVAYDGQQLQIRNRSTDHPLEIGVGTPILAGDGSEAAHITNSNTIAPGATASFGLSAPLQVGQTYYLGAPQAGSKPTIRQLFICPGGAAGSSGGYDIPAPDDPNVDLP